MTRDDLTRQVRDGGRFVVFKSTIWIIVMTFKWNSNVHFVRGGQSAVLKSLRFSLLTLLLGLCGIPWGPIWTIAALIINVSGGRDVTAEIVSSRRRSYA